MTKTEFETWNKVYLINKRDLWWARWISYFWPAFLWLWWTTVRFPGCRGVIAYPIGVEDPMDPKYRHVRRHELVHARQQRGLGLYWSILLYFFVPLPVLFSGRWFVERPAYLRDIKAGVKTPTGAAETLWRKYLFPWPRSWMKKWFEDRISEGNELTSL